MKALKYTAAIIAVLFFVAYLVVTFPLVVALAAAFWIVNGIKTKNRPLIFTQAAYLVLNSIVIVRQFL